MNTLIIRRSKKHEHLILTYNIEKVFRIYLNGEEKMNNIDYNIISDYFNKLENEIYFN